MSLSREKIIEAIGSMSVLELCEFVKEMEDKFGVSAASPTASMQAFQAAAAQTTEEEDEEEEEEPTSWNVVLIRPNEKKIQVIKEVRVITGLPLKESKAIVDEAPRVVKEDLDKDVAKDIKRQLENCGAEVELKGYTG